MSKTTTTADRTIFVPRGQRLAETSALFDSGEVSDATSDESFVLRLNTIVARRSKDAENKIPAGLPDAVSSKGELDRRAELVAFGHWLLLDGRPGMKNQGGKQPNLRTILKCVAVAMYELRVRPKLQEHDLALAGRESRTREITKRDLSARWPVLLGEKKETSFFDAKLRSMEHILPAYLEHLKSGAFVIDGKQIKKSPEIEKVTKAISERSGTKPEARPSVLTKPLTPVPATLPPFEIALRYSSPAQEEEYRNRPRLSLPPSHLRYLPTPTSSTSASGEVRADRKDKIVLVPDIAIRENYKTEALIDRMVIVVSTTTATAPHYLKEKVFDATNAKIFAHDLKMRVSKDDWRASLPELDSTKPTGQHFAIMIQDPTPELLPAILEAIRDTCGINGPIDLHLIEVSVDFYPRAPGLSEEAISPREQMVGLLQRHHWAPHSFFHRHRPAVPRKADARQFYAGDGDERKADYFFAKGPAKKIDSDHNLDNLEIRQRILTTKPGKDIYLNSTVWKGAKDTDYQVSIQNKITNRRNSQKNTMEILPDHERRARIEVTITGSDTLKENGLTTIDDLGSVSFRKLTKPFLSFKLTEIEPLQHLPDDAQAQMRNRGVYGIELRNRALVLEERSERKGAGQQLERYNDREGYGLQSWQEMNDVVGKALDELQRRWKGFSWA